MKKDSPEKKAAREITANLRERLRLRYTGNDWAFATEVQNENGAKMRQKADAVAMMMWPSRGYEVHGFEIKASRTDWLKELNTPAKADPIASQCDFWWVVTNQGIVAPNELPKNWGLLVARGDRDLRTDVRAGNLDPAPITRAFMACFTRRIGQRDAREFQSQMNVARTEGYERGLEEGKRQASKEDERANDKHDRDLWRQIEELFEKKTGRVLTLRNVEKISDQIRRYADAEDFINGYEFRRLSVMKDDLKRTIETLEAVLAPSTEPTP